ncbi:hypothetical protein BDV93DRAFT_182823 [Ceratobasidium sp. AG-I]|nr:hypothetical protein BDV93DRAFT_182823 [Ceratobasidium sp. AG-I]
MDMDTNWCPVCDRLIPPERITLPAAPEPEAPAKSGAEMASKPKFAVARPPTSRRSTGGHNRSNSKTSNATTRPMGVDLLNTQVAIAKPRTVISQAPSALYCSEACREQDQLSSERFQLSLETMFSGPSSTSSLSSPLFVSGSESDADGDVLTNESYFAQLRIHGNANANGRGRHHGSGTNLDTAEWPDRRLSASGTMGGTGSSSEDIPMASPSATTRSPLLPSASLASGHRRQLSYTPNSRPAGGNDGNAQLYAAYPLTFHRTRSGDGSASALARSRKNSQSKLSSSASSDYRHEPTTGGIPTENPLRTDITPTQSLYGLDAVSVSAQGLLVRPALLRAKTERLTLAPMSPISPVSDSAPRLYPPSHYPSSLPASKFGFTPMSTPTSPSGSRSSSRRPSKGDLSRPRRRSDHLSEEALTEATRTKSCEQFPVHKSAFLPMYPALMPAPSTRVVKKMVKERGTDGIERIVEREVVEEYQEERKRLFHFNTEVR